MDRLAVRNRTKGCLVGSWIGVADRWWTRLRGFLGRPPPDRGEGLLFIPSRGVHMYGMKVSLDVVLMDRRGKVVATYPELPPGSRTRVHPEAHYALELPAGTLRRTGTEVGDALEWNESTGGGEGPRPDEHSDERSPEAAPLALHEPSGRSGGRKVQEE